MSATYPAIGPETAPRRLSEHAALLCDWLGRPARLPARWRSAFFARSVDLVRSHLRPIVSQELLALSYSREHFHVVAVGQPSEPPRLLSSDATEVAYAARWLELDAGRTLGSWSSLIEDVTHPWSAD